VTLRRCRLLAVAMTMTMTVAMTMTLALPMASPNLNALRKMKMKMKIKIRISIRANVGACKMEETVGRSRMAVGGSCRRRQSMLRKLRKKEVPLVTRRNRNQSLGRKAESIPSEQWAPRIMTRGTM